MAAPICCIDWKFGRFRKFANHMYETSRPMTERLELAGQKFVRLRVAKLILTLETTNTYLSCIGTNERIDR